MIDALTEAGADTTIPYPAMLEDNWCKRYQRFLELKERGQNPPESMLAPRTGGAGLQPTRRMPESMRRANQRRRSQLGDVPD